MLEDQESLSIHAYSGSSAAHHNTEHEDMKLSAKMQSGNSSIVFNASDM